MYNVHKFTLSHSRRLSQTCKNLWGYQNVARVIVFVLSYHNRHGLIVLIFDIDKGPGREPISPADRIIRMYVTPRHRPHYAAYLLVEQTYEEVHP